MVKLVAEIGINHNGYLDAARNLIDCAVDAGFNYVKFQKRTPELCVPADQKDIIRETPWGSMKYIDYRKRLEFGLAEYDYINGYCEKKGIGWFASAWDMESAKFLHNTGCDIVKIPSAKITDTDLLVYCRSQFKTLIISTGMSDEKEIRKAHFTGKPNVIMHSVSIYPTSPDEVCLRYIEWLKKCYDCDEIGYSGHEEGTDLSVAAVACGATWIERHITMHKEEWGSDHKVSIDPPEMRELVIKIRDIEKALKNGFSPRNVLEREKIKRIQLRGE